MKYCFPGKNRVENAKTTVSSLPDPKPSNFSLYYKFKGLINVITWQNTSFLTSRTQKSHDYPNLSGVNGGNLYKCGG